MKILNILVLIQEFYAIEAVVSLLATSENGRFEPMRHSHARWSRDFQDFRMNFAENLAAAIYDYTVLVVAGELRHCKGRATQYLYGFFNSGSERYDVYQDCTVYRPQDILNAGIRMFDTKFVYWDSGFGGPKWFQIAKAGLMKGRVSDIVFVDHCVDLSHNNSIYFDKEADIFRLGRTDQYMDFLDLKRDCIPEILIWSKRGYRFDQLLQRAVNLGILDINVAPDVFQFYRDEAENRLFKYEPVAWGSEQLSYSENAIITQTQDDIYKRRRESSCRREEYATAA